MEKTQQHTPEEIKQYNKSFIKFMKPSEEIDDGEKETGINCHTTCIRQKLTVSRYVHETKANADITSKPVLDFVTEKGSNYEW